MKNFLKNPIKLKIVGKRGEVDEIVSIPLTIQTIFGQQVLDPNWTWKNVYLHCIIFTAIIIYAVLGTLETFKTTDDVEIKAEASYTFIMSAILPLKLALFIRNRNIFRELYVALKTTLIGAIMQHSDLVLVLRGARKLVIILSAMVIIPVANQEFLTLWGYLTGNLVTLSRGTSILMPMKFPFYEIGWFLHSIFLCFMATTIILDMWFALLIFFLCAANDSLMKILEVELRNDGETEIMYSKRLNETLRQFYIGHTKQMRFLCKMNKMYKWLALVPLCNAAMCLCIILLLLNTKNLDWKFVPHFLPMLAEVFAYNYYGEKIKTKTKALKQALLNFDWTSLSLTDKKSYYIIITYIKKEFGIKTATGNDLSLITMTSVLQVTYRAFTMLQSL